MRAIGWEDALVRVIEKHSALPFQYGVSDCGYLAADTVFAITGEDILKPYRNYNTEKGAARVLRKNKCDSLAGLFAKHLTETPVMLAQRGDIGVIDHNGDICAGVFTGAGFAVKSPIGVLFLDNLSPFKAFRV